MNVQSKKWSKSVITSSSLIRTLLVTSAIRKNQEAGCALTNAVRRKTQILSSCWVRFFRILYILVCSRLCSFVTIILGIIRSQLLKIYIECKCTLSREMFGFHTRISLSILMIMNDRSLLIRSFRLI